MSKIQTNGLNSFELSEFARVIQDFDKAGLQLDGEVWIEGVGSMRVEFDGDRNVAVALEGIE